MAIKTVPSATPLAIRERVLIVFWVAALVANCTLTLVIENWDYVEWLDAIHVGCFAGQCLIAIMLAGLMGRSWLSAFSLVLVIVTLCYGAVMFPQWWRFGFQTRDLFAIPCVAPLALLIASSPCIGLRQLVGLRMAAESEVPWSRCQLSIGDVFSAVAFAAATLVFAKVGVVSSQQDRTEFWASLSSFSLVGFGLGSLIVIPAVWCVFVVESRRLMVIGLAGVLMLPSAIACCILAFVPAEDMSIRDKLQVLGYCGLTSASAALMFVTPLLFLYRRGYRLLRAPFSGVHGLAPRYHASRWIVGAIVAAAVIVNFCIAPLEEAQQREFRFQRWVRSFGGRVEDAGDQTCVLHLSDSRLGDDDLSFLQIAPTVTRLDLSRTEITDAGLEYVGQLTSLKSLELNDTAVTDRGLRHLRQLPNLESLSLANTGVTGSEFAEFESRRQIVSVDFNGAAVTDEGCRGIGELKALEDLNLCDTNITDEGLRHLGDLQKLRRLDLRDTVLHGDGFRDFQQMPDLGVVFLSGSRCGDGVSHLVARAPRLGVLYLDRTTVTDALLSTFQGSSIICELELSGTSVTDDGLSALGNLPNLRKLGLDGTGVTGSGFRDLSARRLHELLLQGAPVSNESLAHLKRFPRLLSIFLNDTPISDRALSHLAGKFFSEVNLAGTQVTAQALLRAHFDAGELTIDDQQAGAAELAALEEIYESVIVIPKSSAAESGKAADAGE